MVFMLVHVQHGWNLATYNGITLVQNILLIFIVILQCTSCNFIYHIFRLWQCGLHGAAYKHQVGSARSNVGQCQLMYGMHFMPACE